MELSSVRPLVDRLRLRSAALRYVRHGWAVTPGACLDGARFACGRAGCPIMGCHPEIESWEDHAGTDEQLVHSWWRHRPHAVLLATGRPFDAIEVPGELGLRALWPGARGPGASGPLTWGPRASGARASGTNAGRPAHPRPVPAVPGPVLATPSGRWMFLVRPGVPLRAELSHRPDVVRHGRGSWIPAAPSRMPDGPVRWVVSPDRAQWSLPAAAAVQAMLVEALGSLDHHPVVAVPRQLSTARRAA